jgi:hypothetical protein
VRCCLPQISGIFAAVAAPGIGSVWPYKAKAELPNSRETIMRSMSLLSLVLFLLLPAASQAFDGEKYPKLAQEAPSEESHFQDGAPSNDNVVTENPEGQNLDQATPTEESVTEEPSYNPEQSPEYLQHVLEVSQSCEKSANETELPDDEKGRYIQDCLQSQGAL